MYVEQAFSVHARARKQSLSAKGHAALRVVNLASAVFRSAGGHCLTYCLFLSRSAFRVHDFLAHGHSYASVYERNLDFTFHTSLLSTIKERTTLCFVSCVFSDGGPERTGACVDSRSLPLIPPFWADWLRRCVLLRGTRYGGAIIPALTRYRILPWGAALS